MLFELDTSKSFWFNDLHDCEVISMSFCDNLLTMVVDGNHESVQDYNKDQIVVELYLAEDYTSKMWEPVTIVGEGIFSKTSTPSLQEFVDLCNSKKYTFEIINIYCNGNAFCIVGQLNGSRTNRKTIVEISVSKVIYR